MLGSANGQLQQGVYARGCARATGGRSHLHAGGREKRRLWATWRTLIWARAIENLAIVVTTQNLFDHSERGLAMVAAPEEILLESTNAGMSVVDVSLERVRYLRGDARRARVLRALCGQAGPSRPAMAAPRALRRDLSAAAARSGGVIFCLLNLCCQLKLRLDLNGPRSGGRLAHYPKHFLPAMPLASPARTCRQAHLEPR